MELTHQALVRGRYQPEKAGSLLGWPEAATVIHAPTNLFNSQEQQPQPNSVFPHVDSIVQQSILSCTDVWGYYNPQRASSAIASLSTLRLDRALRRVEGELGIVGFWTRRMAGVNLSPIKPFTLYFPAGVFKQRSPHTSRIYLIRPTLHVGLCFRCMPFKYEPYGLLR